MFLFCFAFEKEKVILSYDFERYILVFSHSHDIFFFLLVCEGKVNQLCWVVFFCCLVFGFFFFEALYFVFILCLEKWEK